MTGMVCGALLQLNATAALAREVTGTSANPAALVVASQRAQPLVFESNQGQYPGTARFVARGAAYHLTLAPTELRVTVQRPVAAAVAGAAPVSNAPNQRNGVRVEYRSLGIELVGANPAAQMTGEGVWATRVNYFLGNDPARWQVNVPAYQRVRVAEIYPGISLLHYGNQQELEYDFEVAPGADPGQIAMRFAGADRLRVDAGSGDLVLTLGDNELRQPKPVIYQTVRGQRKIIAGSYVLAAPATIRFALGDYDPKLPLVIDPVVSYAKLFGGPENDTIWATALDANGNIYLAGETMTPGFATLAAFQTNFAGFFINHGDVVVAKFNNQLTQTNYITYLGGRYDEAATAIAVDGAGNAYVAGYTHSTNFPTRSAIQTNILGTILTTTPPIDAFIAKLDASGSNLLFSTFYGGSKDDLASGIALDAGNNIYVIGQTESTNFPTKNTLSQTLSGSADGFVVKLQASGTNVAYAMYLGGSASEFPRGVAVTLGGKPLVAGYTTSGDFPVTPNAFQRYLNQNTNFTSFEDSFFVELAPTVGVANYATYLGGTNSDLALSLAVDASGAAYLAGLTQSRDYPRTSPNFYSQVVSNATYPDVFVTKLNPSFTNLDYSVTFGGNGRDAAWDVAVDSLGRASIIGETASTDFPTNGLKGIMRGVNSGGIDAFIAQINATGTAFTYSAYMGGTAEDIGYGVALDAVDNAYFVGQTSSSNFPLQSSSTILPGGRAGFVVKMLADELPVLNLSLIGANAVLSWSAAAPELTVQATTNLSLSGAWVDLNATPIVTNGLTTVIVAPTNAAQFFRLQP